MNKLTPFDLALWAALPMAHTSRIEGRIAMILDSTRRRTLPRRALVLGVAVGAAALIPLAMLRPVAKAQAISQPVTQGSIQLVGITGAIGQNGRWWDAKGEIQSEPAFTSRWQPHTRLSATAGQKALFFAFHLPLSLRNVPIIFNISDATLSGFSITSPNQSAIAVKTQSNRPLSFTTVTLRSLQTRSFDNTVIYGAGFPASLTRTTIRVGRAPGLWKTSVVIPSWVQGRYAVANPVDNQDPPVEMSLSKGEITFDSPFALDGFQFLRFIATDKAGHQEEMRPTLETSRSGQLQMTVPLPQPLSHFRDIQVETRPFAWQEFKDVALQSSK